MFVPVYGYYAAAWGHIVSYSVMVILSFIYGQKHYKIPYNVKRILLYIIIAFIIYLITLNLNFTSLKIKYIVNVIFILMYVGVFYLTEKQKIFIKIK